MPAAAWASAIITSLALLAVGVGWKVGVVDIDFDRKPAGLKDVPPREFLYLDGARAEAYLSQLKEGNETLRTISESVSGEAGGEVGIGTAKLSAKGGREEEVERTVTPTATSNFQALVRTLQENGLLAEVPGKPAADGAGSEASERAAASGCAPRRLPVGDSRFALKWCAVREGDVVSFVATVQQPGFVKAYLALRRMARKSLLRRRAAAALAAIGAPRLPLFADVQTRRTGDGPYLRLVLATQPIWFAAEPSLFSSRLRVVAKVVRRVDRADFLDDELYRRFRPLLRPRLRVIRRRLGIGEKRLRDELRRHDSVTAPAAILVPIAIFSDGRPTVTD